jgi:hypothetical protein
MVFQYHHPPNPPFPKGYPWSFDTQCKSAFNTLKLAFTTAPVLSHWIPDAPQIIETDALDYAIAAIHSIQTPNRDLHPIVFLLQTLGPAKHNYDTHDKELLAIHKVFKVWQHHLEGSSTPIEVFTDHKNLEYFTSSKTPANAVGLFKENVVNVAKNSLKKLCITGG